MFIHLCGRSGTGKTSVAENLRYFLGKRGIAVWPYKVDQPLEDMRDVLNVVAPQYQIPDAPKSIIDNLKQGWITKEHLLTAAKMKILDVVGSWEEKKLFYVVVLDGANYSNFNKTTFPGAFRVLLTASEDVISKRLDVDLIEEGIPGAFGHIGQEEYDIIVDTNEKTIDQVTEEVGLSFRERMEAATSPLPKLEGGLVKVSSSNLPKTSNIKQKYGRRPPCTGASLR